MRSNFALPSTFTRESSSPWYESNIAAQHITSKYRGYYFRLRSAAPVHRARHSSKTTVTRQALNTIQDHGQNADESTDEEGDSS